MLVAITGGTLEDAVHESPQASRWDAMLSGPKPGNELPGYYQSSRRDDRAWLLVKRFVRGHALKIDRGLPLFRPLQSLS